jgi:hypothetical protein
MKICISEKAAFYQHFWTSVYNQFMLRKIEQLNMRLPENGVDVRPKRVWECNVTWYVQ